MILRSIKAAAKRIPGAIAFAHNARPWLERVVGHRLTGKLINAPSHLVHTPLNHPSDLPADAPRVTVVVPNFNDGAFIEMCLKSVAAQDYQNLECLIVDDASSDSSLAIIKRWTAKDSRFRLIQHAANGGLSAARNTGIINASGDFITFLDADDFLYLGSLGARMAPLLANKEQRFVGCYCGWDQAIESETRVPGLRVGKQQRRASFLALAGDCPFIATAPILRTDVVRAAGGFDEQLTQAEDWDLWSRLIRNGYEFLEAEVIALAYRQKRSSMVRRSPIVHLDTAEQLIASAYQSADAKHRISGAPFFFEAPWPHYKQLHTFGPRLISFAALNYAQGDKDAPKETATRFTPHDWAFLVRTLNLEQHAIQGILRAHAHATKTAEVVSEAKDRAEEFLCGLHTAIADLSANEIASTSPQTFDESETSDTAHTRAGKGEFDVLFFPHKDYHVWTAAPIIEELSKRGLRSCTVDLTYAYRDEGARGKIRELGLATVSYNEFILRELRPAVAVCFNDWDHIIVGPLFRELAAQNISTVGIVEGIQDFDDADTGRIRNPYKTVETVLLSGRHDLQFFQDSQQNCTVIGVPRIADLLNEPVVFPERPLVIINQNFTYNVLTDAADAWIASVVDACSELGLDYLISRHPADTTDLTAFNVANESMYDLIARGTVFVSRFSSGILEALAMGKPVIYHNPHGEQVLKFQDGMGVYPTTVNAQELSDALRAASRCTTSVRATASEFLDLHCNTGHSSSSASLAATAIAALAQDRGSKLEQPSQ